MPKNTSNVNEKNLILTRAKAAVIARDFTTAARLYKQLLQEDASNVEYLQELGSIYVKAGEDEKAIPYYEQIIAFYPHHIDSMTSLGAIYRRLKRYDESTAILERALDEGRQIPSVNYNLGFTYREMGNYDDAIDAFNSVISANPNDVLAYNHLGAIYLEKKDYQKSIASFKRGLQIDQNHPILNFNLARCYNAAKMYGDSIRCFENALKTKPGWVECIQDFSTVLIKCQKTKEAADLVKNSILMHPNDVKLLCLLGNVYLNQYDYDSAVSTFKRATKINDKDVPSLSGLANALEKNEKPLDALDKISVAMEVAPDNKDVKKQFAHTLLSANEIETAGVNIRELLKDGGDQDCEVQDLLSQYYICSQNPEKALECYEKINKINHHYKKHLLNSAQRYQQKGNTEAAEHYAKQFVSRDTRNPAGYNMLGSIYSSRGDLEGAIEVYEKSRTLWQPNILADKKLQSLGDQVNTVLEPEEVVTEEEAADQQYEVAEVQEEVLLEAQSNEEGEEFDFTQMGDNVPMAEALVEEEKSFFDELDDATGEAEAADETPDEEAKDEQPQEIEIKTPDYSNLEDESLSPFDELSKEMNKEPLSDAEKLMGSNFEENEPEEPDFEPVNNPVPDSDDDFDFGQFDETSSEEEPPYQPPVPPSQSAPSYDMPPQTQAQPQPQDYPPAPQPVPQDNYQQPPAPPAYPGMSPEMQQKMQENTMDSANRAMETAFNAQRFAEELAVQQKMLEEKLKDVEANAVAAAKEAVQDQISQEVEEKVEEKVQAYAEDTMTAQEDNVPAQEELSETTPVDDGYADITEDSGEDIEFATDSDVGDFTQDMPVEETFEENPEEPAEDYNFANTGNLFDGEESEFTEGDIPSEPEGEPAEGDIPSEPEGEFAEGDIPSEPEGEFTEGENIPSESETETPEEEPLSTPQQLLPTIEKIIADKDSALEHKAEIEMFKKLLSLCACLPEPAKSDFMESQARMKIEYLISKLSGQPGLLETAASLKKSGALGEDETVVFDDNFVPSNHQVRKVLKYMKKLSDELEDKNLGKVLNASVDSILEKIEIAETDVQLFA